MTFTPIPDPSDFEELPAEATAAWQKFPGHTGGVNFAQLVNLQLEEVRRDYSRMRVPWRDELRQPAGMMHGGALATLVDTVVCEAVVLDEAGNPAVRGSLTYKVSAPRPTG